MYPRPRLREFKDTLPQFNGHENNSLHEQQFCDKEKLFQFHIQSLLHKVIIILFSQTEINKNSVTNRGNDCIIDNQIMDNVTVYSSLQVIWSCNKWFY